MRSIPTPPRARCCSRWCRMRRGSTGCSPREGAAQLWPRTSRLCSPTRLTPSASRSCRAASTTRCGPWVASGRSVAPSRPRSRRRRGWSRRSSRGGPSSRSLPSRRERLHRRAEARDLLRHARPGQHALVPGAQTRVGVGQRRAEARRERDREEVADVGDAEIPAQVGPLVEPSLETVVVLRDAGAGACDPLRVSLAGRLGEDLRDQLEDERKQDLVGRRLGLPAAGPRHDVLRVEGRARIAVLEVLEDDGRVVEPEPAVHQDRYLALRVRGEHLGVLRLVSPRPAERHRDYLVREPLLAERDAHLAGEETERTRVELHALASFAGTGSPACPHVGATYREYASQYALLGTRLP